MRYSPLLVAQLLFVPSALANPPKAPAAHTSCFPRYMHAEEEPETAEAVPRPGARTSKKKANRPAQEKDGDADRAVPEGATSTKSSDLAKPARKHGSPSGATARKVKGVETNLAGYTTPLDSTLIFIEVKTVLPAGTRFGASSIALQGVDQKNQRWNSPAKGVSVGLPGCGNYDLAEGASRLVGGLKVDGVNEMTGQSVRYEVSLSQWKLTKFALLSEDDVTVCFVFTAPGDSVGPVSLRMGAKRMSLPLEGD
jgi:hypothetical protein